MSTKPATPKNPGPRRLAVATTRLRSVTPYSQSRAFESEKKPSESPDALDERAWREHLHTTEDGHVFIPPMQFKQSFDAAASRITTEKIEKKGFKNFFEPAVLVMEPLVLPVLAADVKCERLFMTSDGKPAKYSTSGRVWRRFPVIVDWEGTIAIQVLDPRIGEHHVRRVVEEAGSFVGIGRWRPEKRGLYGRFQIVSLEWSEVA